MATKDESYFARYFGDQENNAQHRQPEPEPPNEESEPEHDLPELAESKAKAKPEGGNIAKFPPNKFIAYKVDEKILLSQGALVLFPSLKEVKPIWESPSNSSIIQCILQIAPKSAVEIAQKERVPYAIGGALKEAELINKHLREQRIKAGLPTIGKQRSGAHIASLGPLFVLDDDHDVFARISKLRALGWFAVIYSSWSYMFPKKDAGPEPRGRLILLLNRSVSPEEYRLVWDAIDHLLGGGFDEAGHATAQCYGIHACRSAEAPSRREILYGGALDADALIAFGRSLQPQQPEKTTSTGAYERGPLAEELERVKLMGAVRPPNEYNDWFPGAAAFKRAYPDDEETAFRCFDAWSACSPKYEGTDATRRKFDQVPTDHDGHELTTGIMYSRARRRALKVLNALYPQQAGEIAGKIAPAFKHLDPKVSLGDGIVDNSKPQKGDEPIEPGSVGPKDGIVALEFLLFCFGEKSIEGIPIPQHVLGEARKLSDARRERIDLNGRILHIWDGKNLAADTDALGDAFLASSTKLYGYGKTNKILVWLSSPAADPASADRIRELHKYKGKPGDPNDPAQGKGERPVPMLSADKPALRAIIAKHLAAKMKIESGKGKEKIQLVKICSFAFKSNAKILFEPDASVLDDLLKRVLPERAPELKGVISAPIMRRLPTSTRPEDLLQHDADYLVTKPGFDPRTGLFLAPIGTIADVPTAPTPEQVRAAVDLLQQPWQQFPFASPGEGLEAAVSRSVALYGMMLAANRRALEIAPGIAIDSHAEGMSSGKTLAATLICIIATGEKPTPVVLSTNFDEQKKALITFLVTGNGGLLIDNIPNGTRVDSAALASMMSSPQFMDRLLGANKDINANTQVMIIINGNALNLAGDLATRFLKMRLDTGLERPEDREAANFKITDLVQWTIAHRQQLVAAVHTIVRAYLQACRKIGKTPAGVAERRKVPGSRFGGPCEVLRDAILWACPDLPDPFLGFEASTLSSSTRQEKAQALRALDQTMVEEAAKGLVFDSDFSFVKVTPLSRLDFLLAELEQMHPTPGHAFDPTRYEPVNDGGLPKDDKASRVVVWRRKFRARCWDGIGDDRRQQVHQTKDFNTAWRAALARVLQALRDRNGRRKVRTGQVKFTSQEIITSLVGDERPVIEGAMHWEGRGDKEINSLALSRWLRNNLKDAPINGLVLRAKENKHKGILQFWIERSGA